MIDIVENAKDLATDKVADATKKTEASNTAEISGDKTELKTLKEKVVDLYIKKILNPKKWWLLGLWATFGLNINPMTKMVRNYIVTESEDASTKASAAAGIDGIKDNLEEKASQVEQNVRTKVLEKSPEYLTYDKSDLDKAIAWLKDATETTLKTMVTSLDNDEDPFTKADTPIEKPVTTPDATVPVVAWTVATWAVVAWSLDKKISTVDVAPFKEMKKHPILSGYGERLDPTKKTKVEQFHDWVDIMATEWDDILSMTSGKVFFAGDANDNYGNKAMITKPDGEVISYAHMSKTLVSTGDTVTAGQKIGEVGHTGLATGPHLHLWEEKKDGTSEDPAKDDDLKDLLKAA